MDKYTKLALQVFWFRRYEIHSPSSPQVPVHKNCQISGSLYFVPDINGHRMFLFKARNLCNKHKSVYTTQFWNTYISYLRMSKKLTIFNHPQNTQLRLHLKSEAKTKYSYLSSQTAIIFLGNLNSTMPITSIPLLLDVMYSRSRREQSVLVE